MKSKGGKQVMANEAMGYGRMERARASAAFGMGAFVSLFGARPDMEAAPRALEDLRSDSRRRAAWGSRVGAAAALGVALEGASLMAGGSLATWAAWTILAGCAVAGVSAMVLKWAAGALVEAMGQGDMESLEMLLGQSAKARDFCAKAALAGRAPTRAEFLALQSSYWEESDSASWRAIVAEARSMGADQGGARAARSVRLGLLGLAGDLGAARDRAGISRQSGWGCARVMAGMASPFGMLAVMGWAPRMSGAAGVAEFFLIGGLLACSMGGLIGSGFAHWESAAVEIGSLELGRLGKLARASGAIRARALEAEELGRRMTKLEFYALAELAQGELEARESVELLGRMRESAESALEARPSLERAEEANAESRRRLGME